MKKSILFIVGLMVLILTGCGGGGNSSNDKDKTLVVWSFSDELLINGDFDYFEENFAKEGQKWEGYNIEFALTPAADYLTKIRPVLASGKGAPDLFIAELDMLFNFMEAGYAADLTKLIEDDGLDITKIEADYVPYTIQSGKDKDGILRGMTWQVTPGGIIFRTDLAKKVWGDELKAAGVDTSSSDAIAKWVGDNKFNSLDALVKSSKEAKAAGNYRLFTDSEAIRHFVGEGRITKWVEDGKLSKEKMQDQEKYLKTLAEISSPDFKESLTANLSEWSGEWFAAMSGPVKPVGSDEEFEVMTYSLPTWGLQYVLELNMQRKDADGNVVDNGTYGNWAITNGPSPYIWGGSYLVINAKASDEKKKLAFDFIKTMTLNEEKMIARAKKDGDVYASKKIMDIVTKDYEGRESLGYQNHYDYFLEAANDIDVSYITKYDRGLNELFGKYKNSYISGHTTLEKAFQDFYSELAIAYPEIEQGDDLPYKQ